MLKLALALLLAAMLGQRVLLAQDHDSTNSSSAAPPALNKEPQCLVEGRIDYAAALSMASHRSRKQLLCATFMKASLQPTLAVLTNIVLTRTDCDWAVVFYGGASSSMAELCDNTEIRSSIVHCKQVSPLVGDRSIVLKGKTFPKVKDEKFEKISIPKSVLYQELLPYLPNYKRVFLMDEDISLVGFNLKNFLRLWNCAFLPLPPPLIVQPLIAESNQYFRFVNYNTWQTGRRKSVIATGVGLVEQQVPLFDSIFFQWFVRRVLVWTRDYSLNYGVDWGHDRSWCRAANAYAIEVLKYPSNYTACAILTGATPLHHMNTRSMVSKHKQGRSLFRQKGGVVTKHYQEMIPSWVLPEILQRPNPLDRKYGVNYLKVMNTTIHCKM